MSRTRRILPNAKCWVIKIGSALITDNGCGLKHDLLDSWVSEIVQLKAQGKEIAIVSSGAISEGISRLHWTERPIDIPSLQVAAAVGQMGLIEAYQSCFQKYGIKTAQVLLTHEDISDRMRYLNASSSLRAMLKLGIVPIINENDTVTTDEIRLGDNDSLAGMVTNLLPAQLLVILTDQQGLFNKDPRTDPNAVLIEEGNAEDKSLLDYAGPASTLGRGGMRTKLQAAQKVAQSGANTIIASGKEKNILLNINLGSYHGTLLYADKQSLMKARKCWLADHIYTSGKLIIDNGAVNALTKHGKSLLAVGVLEIEGEFKRGSIVACVDETDTEIARGFINYDVKQAQLIRGKNSNQFVGLIGYMNEPELIHRNNLVLIPTIK